MPTSGFSSVIRDLERLPGRIADEATDEAEEGLERVERMQKEQILRNDAVASTHLWNSFVQTTERTRTTAHLSLKNVAPHAPYVEWGTGDKFRPNPHTSHFKAPTMSPHLVREIKQWMIVKPTFVPYNDFNEAAARVSMVISGNTDKPSGTKAQPFFLPPWKINRRLIRRDIKDGVSRAVRRT